MLRRLLAVFFIGFLTVGGFLAIETRQTPGQVPGRGSPEQMKAPVGPSLPIGQVILFSSGVGYLQRQGEVEGNAQIELSFPGSDVNDLLKSLVLEDLDGGKISTITYDSPDPVEKTLKSFTLDLTDNPTLGELLNQARGERVEVSFLPSTTDPQALLTGVIMGMEVRAGGEGHANIEMLNLVGADGLASVNLARIQRVRFLNPILDSEFKRALDVLASAHDTQKKVVTLGFQGAGKRRVRVGYVVENPIWKTSYRLVLAEKARPQLQGWAIVENRSDEDWKAVRVALVSGRPISFQMGLYEPLYMPRPWVEPELFAFLRPPTYGGAMAAGPQALGNIGQGLGLGGGLGGVGGIGGLGALGAMGGGQNVGRNNLGVGGGQSGMLGGNRYQHGGQTGQQGGAAGIPGRPMQVATNPADREDDGDRPRQDGKLTFEDLQRRRQEQQAAKEKALKMGKTLAATDATRVVASITDAEEIGEPFHYAIEQKVSLPRQKSALLPIVNGAVEATPVSIFDENVQPKFPILGLRFKNTTGHSLAQGPVTVYEDGNYAGDARILDLQPNEERLIGYALDLGTEVKAQSKPMIYQLVSVKLVKGVVHSTSKLRQAKSYLIKNRSTRDRLLLIEHPIRPDWKLIAPEKAAEQTRDSYRFQIQVPSGKTTGQEVVEEFTRFDRNVLLSADEKQVQLLLRSPIPSANVKTALRKAADLKAALDKALGDASLREAELKGILDDQARLRANLAALPPTSAAFKRYLGMFDVQETQIEKLQAEIKRQRAATQQQQKALEVFLADLNVD